MTPTQFLGSLKRALAPAYLFLGPDTYFRQRCRADLIRAHLGSDESGSVKASESVTWFDLAETSLRAVLDDAQSLSLFAPSRVILVSDAERALGRMRADSGAGDEDLPSGADTELLARYLRDPPPDVVMVFDAARFDFEGEDKRKLERVQKYYSCVPAHVEFRRFSPDEARREARLLAGHLKLQFAQGAIELLVEALDSDMSRIAVEIEKLSLFRGADSDTVEITEHDITALVPDARQNSVFALVNAIGRRNRLQALEVLDTLCRDGEYLPLALTFLSTQFRLTLMCAEAGLRTAQQVQSHFSKQGIPMWGARAEQIVQTMNRFSKRQLARALAAIFDADRDLRGTRPDDRVVLERLVFRLNAD